MYFSPGRSIVVKRTSCGRNSGRTSCITDLVTRKYSLISSCVCECKIGRILINEYKRM